MATSPARQFWRATSGQGVKPRRSLAKQIRTSCKLAAPAGHRHHVGAQAPVGRHELPGDLDRRHPGVALGGLEGVRDGHRRPGVAGRLEIRDRVEARAGAVAAPLVPGQALARIDLARHLDRLPGRRTLDARRSSRDSRGCIAARARARRSRGRGPAGTALPPRAGRRAPRNRSATRTGPGRRSRTCPACRRARSPAPSPAEPRPPGPAPGVKAAEARRPAFRRRALGLTDGLRGRPRNRRRRGCGRGRGRRTRCPSRRR